MENVYDRSDFDNALSNVAYLEKLDKVLDLTDIERSNVCLLGTTSLAALNIVENGDIDLITFGKYRDKLYQFAKQDSDSYVTDRGMAYIREDIELSMADRLCKGPYFFGLDDESVVADERYHFTVDGYKFLRPELVVSMKGAKRRDKDIEDLDAVSDSGLLESEDWDWNLVHITPPWERSDPTANNLFDDGIHSLRNDGISTTFTRTMQYFSYRFDRYLEHSDSLPARLLNAYQRGKQLSPPVSDDVDLHYPLPNLLSRQYDQRGNFSAYKLIEALLDGTSLNQHSKEPVVVSPDGEIQRGFSTIASKITQWSDDIPRDANEKKFHVKIQDNLKKEGGTKRDSQYRNESLRDRKETLLKQTGAAFYAILWPGIHSHFDAVEEMIRNELTVIDSNDYDLGDGFAEFVRDVYSKDERNQKWFRENKIHELERNPPVIRVLTLEILNPSFRMDNGQLMAEQTSELKMEIRRRASELTDKYVYGTELHMTDNFINNAHTGYLIANIDKYT